jgi:hypothetical protein
MATPDIYKYIPLTAIQQPFFNKDTTELLSNGYIYFYKDEARTTYKDVFKFSGTPSNPSYTALPNPLQLGAGGTPVDPDNGNDLLIYGFPWDSDGNPELYFIQVYDILKTDVASVLQFTRESYPQQIQPEDSPAEITFINNLIPNGQFVTYEQPEDGILTDEITPLAMGGWTFILANSFSSTNTVEFTHNYEPSDTPETNPINIFKFTCSNPNPAEDKKDLTLIFPNVNFLEGRSCTLQFEALANGIPFNLQLVEGRFYGTDGSDYEESVIETFTITPTSYNKYLVNFEFNSNDGKVVTSDSEVRLIWRFPTDVATSGYLINFILVEGTFGAMIYPDVSQYQAVQQAIAGSIKIPSEGFDGAALDTGKFLQYGLDTSTYTPRLSLIPGNPVKPGTVYEFAGSTVPDGDLECNGASYDLTSAYPTAPDYSALYAAIGTNWGYGIDGFIPTKTATATLTHECYNFGTASAPNAHTSGFTITTPQNGDSTHAQIVQVVTVAASAITAGSYYEIKATSGRSTLYWFRKNGLGTAPISSGALIKAIDILSSDTADQVATKIVAGAICQFQVPEKRGYFGRGWDHGAGNDPNAATRLNSSGTRTIGDLVGSYQADAYQDHKHAGDSGNNFAMFPGPGFDISGSSGCRTTANTGLTATTLGYRTSTETRPKNAYFMYVIKT